MVAQANHADGHLALQDTRLVRTEVWTLILAYNLIRTMIAQAADKHRLEPLPSASRELFKYWKHFTRWPPRKGTAAQLAVNYSTNSCSTLWRHIELATDPNASNHVSENADERSTIE